MSAPPDSRFSWRPTNKWIVGRVAALGTLATLVITSGWHAEASLFLVGLIVSALTTWLTPNEPTPGGVPR